MVIREIIGWFLAIESAFAICAIFTDDWWEWFAMYNTATAFTIGIVSWVVLIEWLISGTWFW